MWFWLLSSIAGSIIGSATESWFRDTKLGIWFSKRMKKFPQLAKRLDTLESQIKEMQQSRYDDWK